MTIYRQDLERVYALIEREEGWTQHTAATNKSGKEVGARQKSAKCFCLLGAVWNAVPGDMDELREEMEALANTPDVALFNDSHTHAEVLQLLKDAIERAPVRPADDRARVV